MSANLLFFHKTALLNVISLSTQYFLPYDARKKAKFAGNSVNIKKYVMNTVILMTCAIWWMGNNGLLKSFL